jgi:S-adenosylmethionine hydrolase
VAVAKAGGPGFLVGPDNGLLGFAIDALGGAVSAAALPALSPRPGFGATFDGRDVFAPAAARLWVGARPEELGKRVATHSLVRLEPPQLHVEHGRIEAEVLWVDSFGNVQLAARHADAVDARLGIEQLVVASSTTVPSRSVGSFAGGPGDAPEGDAVGLLADSNGHLALVCRRRSAATVLGVKAGDVITLRNREPADPETQLGARS